MPHSATCLTCTCYCRLLAIFITPCRMSFVSSHSIALISPKCHDIPADAFQKFDMRQLVADVPLLPAGHGVLAGGAWQEIDGIAQRWEDSHRWTVEHSQRIILTLVQSWSILSQQNVNLGKNKPRISETDLTKMFCCQVTSVLLTSSPIWCFTRQSRGSTWASAMVTFLVVFSLWEARMSCCSGKLTQRKQSQKILVSPRSAWRRFWRNRWTEQLYRIFWSFAYFSPCQAVQQAEKEEADRIRVKAFKERGLTYTAQGDCEDMY